MNKVQKSIYENIVAPAIGNIAGTMTGVVVDFNAKLNVATVSFGLGSDDEEPMVKRGVPYTVSPGVKKSALFPGDTVVLGFMNNSYKRPYIIEVMDKEYGFNTRPMTTSHFRKGSNVTDYYSTREGESW